jgi:hypothetical protein
MEHIVVLLVDPGPSFASCSLLTIEVETLIPLAISDVLAHPTYVFAWDKWVILDQIQEIWICPFFKNSTVILFSTIMMFVEDQYYLSL